MFINPKTRYEKLASKDKSRPVLASLFLRIVGEGNDRRGYLEGTDSYKLGRIPVGLSEADTEGFVPVEAFTTARKLRASEIVCNGAVEVKTGTTTAVSFPRAELGQFPNSDQLLDLVPARFEGQRFTIGFSAKLLAELAESMGADGVTLEFTATAPFPGRDHEVPSWAPSNLRPITVRPLTNSRARCDHPDAVGLLMPIRHDPPADARATDGPQ